MKRNLLLAIFLLCTVSFAFGQREVSGTVTSAEDGESLPGVSVIVKGTVIGTTTDLDGYFLLDVPDDQNVLIFSYIGMATQEAEIGGSSTVNVSLEPDVLGLDEVVVTAIGIEREKKAIGYAVQDVDGEELVKANTVSVLDGLSGKVAGVQITRTSGSAGAASRVVIRGQTSFNGDNEALMVIDGIRFNNEENHSERSLAGVSNSNRAIDINPDDIESISVLKGAAATALYGVEGARGVIVITTKKGKAQKGVSVSYNFNYTMSNITNMVELQDKFTQGAGNVWYGPDGNDGIWWGGFARALSFGAAIDTSYYDGSTYKWDKNGRITGQSDPSKTGKVSAIDNVGNLYQTGRLITNNIALSGGDGTTNYRFGFGSSSEDGVVPLNTFNRNNFSVSVGTKFFNKLEVSATINYVKTKGRRIQQGSNTSGLMLGLLRTPTTFDNSNGLSDPVDYSLEDAAGNGEVANAYQFQDGSQRNYRGGGGYDNPYWVINNAPFYDNVSRMYGSVRVAYPINNWVVLSTTMGTDFYTDNRKQEFEIGSRTFPGGQVVEDQYNYRHTDLYFQTSGNGNLADNFTLGYTLGMNFWNKYDKENFTQGDGLNFVGFREMANAQTISTQVNHRNERSFSVYGSLELGYKSLLYLTLTGRQDYLSTLIVPTKEFNTGDISVFYPSASLSFVFSELLESDAIPYGKIRVSFAQVGGGAPASYLTSTNFTVPIAGAITINDLSDGWTNGISFPFQGQSGFTYNALQGNISLVPSKTTDFEIGADLRFLNNRLGVDVTYYNRTSNEQIIAIQIPSSTGFQRAVINSGELSTNGFEVILNTTPVQKNDFQWDLNFNFSTWTTWVESLPEGVPNQYLDGFTSTGVYNIAPETDENGNVTKKYEYGQLYSGVWQRANDGNEFNADLPYNPEGAIVIDDSGSPDADDPAYNDNYGFPLVDPVNQVAGNPNPDFLLGINSIIKWKNLSFDFLIDIKEGGDLWNGTKGALTFFGRTQITADRIPVVWNPNQGFVHDYDAANFMYEGVLASDGSANTIRVPLDENWFTGNGGGFGAVGEHFIEDGSSYRLRYVRLAYDFTDLLGINGLTDLTLSFTGRNLWISTPYTGVDPETSLIGSNSNGQGLDYFQMPGTRSYAIGLSAKF